MHKISKKSIQDLANQLAAAALIEDTSLLLEKARELYESITLLHNSPEVTIEESYVESSIEKEHFHDESQNTDTPETNDSELSVKERIQKIMETAPTFESDTNTETPVAETTEKEILFDNKNDIEEKTSPKVNIDDEFKDAISADYAAELFESAEKIEISKKSLNDKLSQKQLQIGLNDRIAFVKHLFNGSQADFNRVLSQLNSFQTESQAKSFIDTVVKPDFNWTDKLEYEERLIVLIERTFL